MHFQRSIRLIYILFLATFYSAIFAQGNTDQKVDKSNYALLWEISGGGLEKPSYLFGTMHVRDARAFEFPDSLLTVLQEVDAYAMEIQPDSIALFYINLLSDQLGSKENKLKEQMSAEAYDRLNRAILEKTGKPIDSLDSKDPMFVSHLLNDFDEPKTKNMKGQFVDLYLYKVAARLGKATYGLENIEDYEDLTSAFFDRFEQENEKTPDWSEEQTDSLSAVMYGKMLDVYRSGDLEKMDQMINGWREGNEAYEAEMLDRRNERMLVRMQKIMESQTGFFAMGTAHLPGDFGVLSLLKKAGYQLRPVSAQFTGVAERFDMPPMLDENWKVIRDSNYGFTFSLPGIGMDILPTDETDSDMMIAKMAFDVLEMNAYMVMRIYNASGVADEELNDMYETLFQNFSGEDSITVTEKKHFVHPGGWKGQELSGFTGEDAYLKGRFLSANGAILIALVLREDNQFDEEITQRFFNNLKIEKKQIGSAWQTYEDRQGGFRVDAPTIIEQQRRVIEQEGVSGESLYYPLYNLFFNDVATGSNFLIQYYDQPLGYVMEDDREALQEAVKRFNGLVETTPAKIDTTFENNQMRLTVHYETTQQQYRLYVFNAGSRFYLFFAETKKRENSDEVLDRFINSVSILEPESLPLTQLKIEDLSLSIGYPDKPVLEEVINYQNYPQINEKDYRARDSMSGYYYSVSQRVYSPYFEIRDREAFYRDYKKNNISERYFSFSRDTIFQDKPAVYSIYDYPASTTRSYSLVFQRNPYQYELLFYGTDQTPDSVAWNFFDSFQFHPSPDHSSYLEDRHKILVSDLFSDDSIRVELAQTAMDNYKFLPAHLPAIYAQLNQHLNTRDSVKMKGVEYLIRELGYTHDDQTLRVLQDIYENDALSDDFHEQVLSALLRHQEKESTDLFFELAPRFKPNADFSNYHYSNLLQAFRDSTELLIEYLPQLVDLTSLRAFRAPVLYSLDQAIERDSSGQVKQQLRPRLGLLIHQYQIMAEEKNLYQLDSIYQTLPDNWLYHYQQIIKAFPDHPEALQAARQMLKLKDDAYIIRPAVTLHLAGTPPEVSILERLYKKPALWYQYTSMLEEANIPIDIPNRFLDPWDNIRAYSEYAFVADDETVDSLVKIDERIIDYQGKPHTLFGFWVSSPDYQRPFLGIAIFEKEQRGLPVLIRYDWAGFDRADERAELERMIKEAMDSP